MSNKITRSTFYKWKKFLFTMKNFWENKFDKPQTDNPTLHKWILDLWNDILKDKESDVLYSIIEGTRIASIGTATIILKDTRAIMHQLSVIRIDEQKKICFEIDIHESMAKLFKLYFDEEIARRVHTIEHKKRMLVADTIKSAIDEVKQNKTISLL
jgi:hypothetical protein